MQWLNYPVHDALGRCLVGKSTCFLKHVVLPAEVFAAEHSVMLSVNLRSGVHKYHFTQCIQVLILQQTPSVTMLKVARVRNSRLADIFLYLKERAT